MRKIDPKFSNFFNEMGIKQEPSAATALSRLFPVINNIIALIGLVLS
jgi:hypothetical protein